MIMHFHVRRGNLTCGSANLYFPFRLPSGRELIARFLSQVLGVNVLSCEAIEFEYERPETRLKPAALLGFALLILTGLRRNSRSESVTNTQATLGKFTDI